jgi:hypothetical protein
MREIIDIVEQSMTPNDKIVKGTWTEWQDRNGIYVVGAGTNSVYAGFCSQEEAQAMVEKLGSGMWRVLRWGIYKDLNDEQAMADEQIRRERIRYGFYVPPRD